MDMPHRIRESVGGGQVSEFVGQDPDFGEAEVVVFVVHSGFAEVALETGEVVGESVWVLFRELDAVPGFVEDGAEDGAVGVDKGDVHHERVGAVISYEDGCGLGVCASVVAGEVDEVLAGMMR